MGIPTLHCPAFTLNFRYGLLAARIHMKEVFGEAEISKASKEAYLLLSVPLANRSTSIE